MNLKGYTLRPDGDFEKIVTYRWGIERKFSATEKLIRNAKGALIRVENRLNPIRGAQFGSLKALPTPRLRP